MWPTSLKGSCRVLASASSRPSTIFPIPKTVTPPPKNASLDIPAFVLLLYLSLHSADIGCCSAAGIIAIRGIDGVVAGGGRGEEASLEGVGVSKRSGNAGRGGLRVLMGSE